MKGAIYCSKCRRKFPDPAALMLHLSEHAMMDSHCPHCCMHFNLSSDKEELNSYSGHLKKCKRLPDVFKSRFSTNSTLASSSNLNGTQKIIQSNGSHNISTEIGKAVISEAANDIEKNDSFVFGVLNPINSAIPPLSDNQSKTLSMGSSTLSAEKGVIVECQKKCIQRKRRRKIRYGKPKKICKEKSAVNNQPFSHNNLVGENSILSSQKCQKYDSCILDEKTSNNHTCYKFQCELCKMLFTTLSDIDSHKKETHTNLHTFDLNLLRNRSNLKIKKSFTCMFCSMEFQNDGQLEIHKKNCNMKKRNVCRNCGTRFVCKYVRQICKKCKHMNDTNPSNTNGSHVSKTCGRIITENMEGPTDFTGDALGLMCNKKGLGNDRDNLNVHVAENPATQFFKNNRVAVIKHDEKWKCIKCGIVFSNFLSVTKHIGGCKLNVDNCEAVDDDDIVWVCIFCSQGFHTDVEFFVHHSKCKISLLEERKLSGKKILESISSIIINKAKKRKRAEKYKCYDCGQKFTNRLKFKRHNCEITLLPCKVLVEKFSLKGNSVLLSDIVKNCKTCGKEFYEKTQYSFHLKTCERLSSFIEAEDSDPINKSSIHCNDKLKSAADNSKCKESHLKSKNYKSPRKSPKKDYSYGAVSSESARTPTKKPSRVLEIGKLGKFSPSDHKSSCSPSTIIKSNDAVPSSNNPYLDKTNLVSVTCSEAKEKDFILPSVSDSNEICPPNDLSSISGAADLPVASNERLNNSDEVSILSFKTSPKHSSDAQIFPSFVNNTLELSNNHSFTAEDSSNNLFSSIPTPSNFHNQLPSSPCFLSQIEQVHPRVQTESVLMKDSDIPPFQHFKSLSDKNQKRCNQCACCRINASEWQNMTYPIYPLTSTNNNINLQQSSGIHQFSSNCAGTQDMPCYFDQSVKKPENVLQNSGSAIYTESLPYQANECISQSVGLSLPSAPSMGFEHLPSTNYHSSHTSMHPFYQQYVSNPKNIPRMSLYHSCKDPLPQNVHMSFLQPSYNVQNSSFYGNFRPFPFSQSTVASKNSNIENLNSLSGTQSDVPVISNVCSLASGDCNDSMEIFKDDIEVVFTEDRNAYDVYAVMNKDIDDASGVKRYICPKCAHSFPNVSEIAFHLKKAHEKIIGCQMKVRVLHE